MGWSGKSLFPFLIIGMVAILIGISAGCERKLNPEDDNGPDKNPLPDPEIGKSYTVIQDTFQGVPLVIVGSESLNFFVSFVNDKGLSFSLSKKRIPVILTDQEGNEWDIFGEALSGPRMGEKLSPTESYTGYWFALSTFYPVEEIFGQNRPLEGFDSLAASEGWLVNINYVRDGGPGKDGIPALEDPEVTHFKQRDYFDKEFYLDNKDLVVGIRVDTVVIAYPHPILNWHEIVNHRANDTYFAVSFCPLTGTAVCWNRELEGGITTFGVSGLLYNNNVLPYDRATESFWSQIRNDCIYGDLIRTKSEVIPIVETTWETWKSMYPETWVLTNNTGYQWDYTYYPYGEYKTLDEMIYFPISNKDERLPAKERAYSIILGGKAKVYRFRDF